MTLVVYAGSVVEEDESGAFSAVLKLSPPKKAAIIPLIADQNSVMDKDDCQKMGSKVVT